MRAAPRWSAASNWNARCGATTRRTATCCARVYDLRRAIDGPFEAKLLHTIPRVGYRLAVAEGDGGQ